MNRRLRSSLPFMISLFAGLQLAVSPSHAQLSTLTSPRLGRSLHKISEPIPSNSISHIALQGSTIWIGTDKGVARSLDGGRSWQSLRSIPQFVNDGIFAIAVRSSTIWTSTGFTKEVNGQGVQTGSGYTFSTDNGSTWTHVPQTLDARGDSVATYGNNRIKFLPVVVPEQNVTFDIALTDRLVWIASWASGLRKSSDRGQTWQRTVLPAYGRHTISPADSLSGYYIDPRDDNNFLVFSVFPESDSVVWAGSAGGINKSTDGGLSWVRFSSRNQVQHILGNWVIAIAGQRFGTTNRIWCTNWIADSLDQYGVSCTEDGGRTWKTFLNGIKAYDFAFKDSIAYVATEDGIYRSPDGGLTWMSSGTIVDPNSGEPLTTSAFFCIGVLGDTVYAGGNDGLVKTIDNASRLFGQRWDVVRTYKSVANARSTYAYPNPFSPAQELVRIHFSTGGIDGQATIELFDFGMNRVRTLIKDAPRSGSTEHDESWDGRDDTKRDVANGVYFYRVTVDGNDPAWGKIMVLR